MYLRITLLAIAIMSIVFTAKPLLANSSLSYSNIKQFTKQAELKFGVIDNFHNNDGSFIGQIQLINTSDVALPSGESNWQLYFHSIRKFKTTSTKGLTIEHVNGDLHRVSPTAKFKGLAVGKTLTINYEAEVYIISYSDFMPRAFMTINNKDAAVFANTDTEELTQFVLPIVEERQLKKFKSPQDLSTIATAQVRYKLNQDNLAYLPSKADALKRIIPKPLKVDFSRGKTMLDNQWLVSYQGSLKSEVNVFLDDLKALYNIELNAQADHIAVKDNA